MPPPYSMPIEWEHALLSRLSIAPQPPSKPFSHARDFGWLSFDLPSQFFTRSSFCWYVEMVDTLREALAHFAHAAAITPDVWKTVSGLHVYNEDELEVRYRFHVGSRLADVAYLLDRRQAYSTAFHQAADQLLQIQTHQSSEPECLRVPVSLVVKPDQWTPTLLNEIIFICKAHRASNQRTGLLTYEIVDVQIDLQDTSLPETAPQALMWFLESDVPFSALSLSIQEAPWTCQNVVALIRAIDRSSITSLKICLPTSMHYEAVMQALEGTSNLGSVDIVVQSHQLPELSGYAMNGSSMIPAVRWTSPSHINPPRSSNIKSLRLSCSHKNWTSQLHAVGHQLLALQIIAESGSERVTVPLLTVLKACPKLMSLELHGVVIDSLETFVDGYESGSCQLRSLAMRAVDITHSSSVSRLAVALKDMNTSVAQNLLEFSWIQVPENLSAELIEAFADALDLNPRLRLLELQCSRETPAVARLLRHHFRPLLPYDHPLLCGRADSLGQLSRLSYDVVGHILGYVGVHEKRRVRIHHKKYHE